MDGGSDFFHLHPSPDSRWEVCPPGRAKALRPLCFAHAQIAAATFDDAVIRSIEPPEFGTPCRSCERGWLARHPEDQPDGVQLLHPTAILLPRNGKTTHRGGAREGAGRHRGEYDLADEDLRKKAQEYVEQCQEDDIRPTARGLASLIGMNPSWLRVRLDRIGCDLGKRKPPDLRPYTALAAAVFIMLFVAIDASDGRIDHLFVAAGVVHHLCRHTYAVYSKPI